MRYTMAFIAALAMGSVTMGQNVPAPGGVHIAKANPVEVFNQLQETKDIHERLSTVGMELERTRIVKNNALRDVQLKLQRLPADDPQRAALTKQLEEETAALSKWMTEQKAALERTQKDLLTSLRDRFNAAVAQVASEEGFDLVVSSGPVPSAINLDRKTIDQFLALLATEAVFFRSDRVAAVPDISAKIMAKMSKDYEDRQVMERQNQPVP